MDEEEPAIEKLVGTYIKLRDRKAELKKKFDEDTAALDAGMERAEAYFLGYMKQNGLTSLPTKYGTPYKSTRTSATVEDKVGFLAWLLADPERLSVFLDIKANKTAVATFKEEKQDLPPGVKWTEQTVVNVNRK